ncbi:MAG: DUF6125 family protein [Candidatus Helarchaeota archaeon]
MNKSSQYRLKIKQLQDIFITIDGIWFLECEKRFGFKKTFDIDCEVWKIFGKIMMKRLKKQQNIENNCTIDEAIRILEIYYDLEGTNAIISKVSEKEFKIIVKNCIWYNNLVKSNRDQVVRCDEVDKQIYPTWFKILNEGFELELLKSMPSGDNFCEFRVKLVNPK